MRMPAPVQGRLGGLAFRTRERVRALRDRNRHDAVGPDGLPLPPPYLRVLVTGVTNPDSFINEGAATARRIDDLLEQVDVSVADLDRILDFGCGCARVTRHWAHLSDVEIWGCDYNPRLVEWCAESMPFMQAFVNPADPPLPFGAGEVDLTVLISVLTHWSAERQARWVEELARVTRPGRFVIATTHGERYRHKLPGDELRTFDAGDIVVRFESAQGSNMCTTYHSRTAVERLVSEWFDVAAFDPGLSDDRDQDAYLLVRKR
jgi:SAM-dependent methyltransferase